MRVILSCFGLCTAVVASVPAPNADCQSVLHLTVDRVDGVGGGGGGGGDGVRPLLVETGEGNGSLRGCPQAGTVVRWL